MLWIVQLTRVTLLHLFTLKEYLFPKLWPVSRKDIATLNFKLLFGVIGQKCFLASQKLLWAFMWVA